MLFASATKHSAVLTTTERSCISVEHLMSKTLCIPSTVSLVGLVIVTVLNSGSAAAQPETAEQFAVAHEDKPDEVLSLAISAGGVLAHGNTRSWTANAGTKLRLVRDRHGLSLDWTFAYGRADLTPNDDAVGYEDTVRNSNARLRYDFFFTEHNAVFAAVAHRWDTFAGLDTRLQGQIGYLRTFVSGGKHRLWGEIGYDVTWDNFDPEAIQDPATEGDVLCDPMQGAPADVAARPEICQYPDTQVVHAARAYVGYENSLNEAVQVNAGLEALLNLQEPKDLRLNFDAGITSSLYDALSLELKLKVLFDNVPVPDKQKTDLLVTLNLVYTVDQADPEEDE